MFSHNSSLSDRTNTVEVDPVQLMLGKAAPQATAAEAHVVEEEESSWSDDASTSSPPLSHTPDEEDDDISFFKKLAEED